MLLMLEVEKQKSWLLCRFSALSELPYPDPLRLDLQGIGQQDLQPQLRDNRLFVPSGSYREARSAHVSVT